jgi:hypothetical protein
MILIGERLTTAWKQKEEDAVYDRTKPFYGIHLCSRKVTDSALFYGRPPASGSNEMDPPLCGAAVIRHNEGTLWHCAHSALRADS